MALDTRTKKGFAQIDGVNGTFGVIVWAEPQNLSASQNWEEKMTKNRLGSSIAVRANDELMDMDLNFKLVADTVAHLTTAVGASDLGHPFIAPLTSFTLSGGDLGFFAGTYQLAPGNKIDLVNDDVGSCSYKLRRWANAAQNTLMNSTPA